ncbi:MAG: hypothetical protein HQ592_03925 [Planctomycetes bacterium]|nr:hypothetical protein [Planctomycetota bacterium]
MNQKPDAPNEDRLRPLLDAVRRRLLARKFGSLACRNVLVALALVLPAAVFSAFRPGPQLPGAAAALCGLGILMAIAQALAHRPGTIDAALYVDKHFNLQERLSSFVTMAAADVPSAVQAALAQDAFAHARRIQASVACPLSIPRSAPFTGAALFCVAALLFGTATQGNAGGPVHVINQLDPMRLGGDVSYVPVNLSPELQAALDKIPNAPADDLDATLGRLDDLLGKFRAMQGIAESLDESHAGDLDAEDIKAMLPDTPNARTRLKAALEQAAKELGADKTLAEAVRKAQEALARGSEEDLAKALGKLIGKLATETAGHQLDNLKALKEQLVEARNAEPDDGGGVTRIVTTGRTIDDNGAPDAALSPFPKDAAIKARGAVEAGRVPARYRWFVERYFRDDESPADRAHPPSSSP